MKNIFFGLIGFLLLSAFSSDLKQSLDDGCSFNKDEMVVVMRFEIKVLPDKVSFWRESFEACKIDVLEKEPGCLDYSAFQSYSDSTIFCITETWKTKEDHNAHMKLEHTRKHIQETRGVHDTSFKPKANYVYWVCPEANLRD